MSPNFFGSSVAVMTAVSPMPTGDEVFDELEQNGQFDITAPWIEVQIDGDFSEEYPTEFSGRRYVPSDFGRDHVVIGDQLIDSRMLNSTVEVNADDEDVSSFFISSLSHFSAFQDLLPSRNCSPLSPGTLELPRPDLIFDHLPWPPRAVKTPDMERPLDAYGNPERPVVYRNNSIASTDDSAEYYVYATTGQVFMKSGHLADVTPYMDVINGLGREKMPIYQRKLECFRTFEQLLSDGGFTDILAEKMWKEIENMGLEKEVGVAGSINDAKRIPIREMKKNRKRRQDRKESETKKIKLEESDECEDNKENV